MVSDRSGLADKQEHSSDQSAKSGGQHLHSPARTFLKFANSRLALVLLLLVAGLAFARGLRTAVSDPEGGKDFQWSGSRALLEHRNPYSEYFEYKEGLRDKSFILTQGPLYPASGYVFLWPFAALDWPTAKVAWAIANVLFTIAIVAGLQRLWPLSAPRLVVIATALLLTATCYRTILGVGQHALLSLSFFIWSLILVDRRKVPAGLFLAVSWFKYTITFPLTFIFLTKKKYSVVLLASTIHVILLGFVSWWIHEPPHQLVLQPVAVALRETGTGDMDIFRILQGMGLDKSIPSFLSPVLLAICGIASMFLKSKDDLMTLSLLALISYTIFLHQWYDIMVLVFPFWYCMKHGLTQPITKLFCGLIILAWYTSPIVATVEAIQRQVEGLSFLSVWLEASLHAATMTLLYATIAYLIYLQLSKPSTQAPSPSDSLMP